MLLPLLVDDDDDDDDDDDIVVFLFAFAFAVIIVLSFFIYGAYTVVQEFVVNVNVNVDVDVDVNVDALSIFFNVSMYTNSSFNNSIDCHNIIIIRWFIAWLHCTAVQHTVQY